MPTPSFSFFRPALCGGLLAAFLLPGCTAKMRNTFDAAWETVDPMGHRKEHQMRNYPRGKSTGVRLPYND